MASLGELLRRLPALGRGQDDVGPRGDPPVLDPADAPAPGSAVRRLLASAQAEALDAYRRAGLPDTPGVLGLNPDALTWDLLGAEVSPAAKWNYVLDHPPEAGWRYASLSQIGRRERPDDPVIAMASDLLDQVAFSLARLDGEDGGASGRHDLEIAFELTMTWMRLVEAVSIPATPPKVRTRSTATKSARKPRKPAAL